MADLLTDIAASKDRISKLLEDNSTGYDILDAVTAARTGKSTFGDAFNAMKANRLKSEMGFRQLLGQEQGREDALDERRLTREQMAADREAARNLQIELAKMRDQTTRDVAEMRARGGESGRPAAPIQNFNQREELVTKYGEGSPKVRTFDAYVRALQLPNLNDRVDVINPAEGPTPIATLPKGVSPDQNPALKGEQRAATEAAESAQKKKDNMPKAQTALTQWERKVKTVTDNVDKALALAQNSSTATGYGNLLFSALPETDARALNNYLDTIKANLGFDELQKMRDASPTGGALGAVSEFENRLLQAVQAALDPRQSKQLVENLQTIKQLYPQVLADRKKAFAADFKDVLSQQSGGASVPDGVTPELWNAMTPEERALWQN